MADEFYLKMPDFHVTFRDLLHAVNLRHGTEGFTSPPKEGVLRFFFCPEKSNGFGRVWTRETWVPKASTLPLDHRSRFLAITCMTKFQYNIKFHWNKSYLRFGGAFCSHLQSQAVQYLFLDSPTPRILDVCDYLPFQHGCDKLKFLWTELIYAGIRICVHRKVVISPFLNMLS